MSILVAGIGNLFLGDDGFAPEVIRRLNAEGPPPDRVRYYDYGIRGVHLAYDILYGVDRLIIVDALPLDGGTPGELVVLEVGPGDIEPVGFDAHAMSPGAVLGNVERLGGEMPRTYVIGVRVDGVVEEIGLTPRVEAAVPAAMAAVRTLVDRILPELPPVDNSEEAVAARTEAARAAFLKAVTAQSAAPAADKAATAQAATAQAATAQATAESEGS
ncbi:hydrogenase maturation protease [Actinoplanes sp. CA-030573]|uniref:hydrogenase maturation protease n=1 Tax=Actinoplanes sp. CA-030573 TaxID=3239898 RepID=UPI003D916CDA